jgi:hypothetical protein
MGLQTWDGPQHYVQMLHNKCPGQCCSQELLHAVTGLCLLLPHMPHSISQAFCCAVYARNVAALLRWDGPQHYMHVLHGRRLASAVHNNPAVVHNGYLVTVLPHTLDAEVRHAHRAWCFAPVQT